VAGEEKVDLKIGKAKRRSAKTGTAFFVLKKFRR
jgi:hypothetical protein